MKISESANTPAMNDDELTRVFNEIDDDGNGYITPREAKKAFKKLAEKFNISRVRTNIISGRPKTIADFLPSILNYCSIHVV